MNGEPYQRELHIALKLAQDAGAAAMARYQRQNLDIQSKGADGPVTEADRAAHRLITLELAEAFPKDAIVSEEGEDDYRRRQGHRTWIVDPLDGTSDFIAGNGEFTILIGLVEHGRPTLGVIYQPVGDALYYAVRGQGAFLVCEEKPPRPLHVSDEKLPACMTAVVSRSHRSKAVDDVLKAIRPAREIVCGSVGLKIAKVVLGEADLYFHPSRMTKIWDTAGPQVILEEAGGIITDFAGNPLRYDADEIAHTHGIAVSNGAAHTKLLELAREAAHAHGLI